MRQKLKPTLIILILALVATFISSFSSRVGGAAGNLEDDNAFIVTQTSLDSSNYYKPQGISGVWYIHGGSPPQGATCNTNSDPDLYQTVAAGWPISFAYYFGFCGTYDTYSPLSFAADYVVYAILLILLFIFLSRMKIFKHLQNKPGLTLLGATILIAFLAIRFALWHSDQVLTQPDTGSHDFVYLLPLPILIAGLAYSGKVFRSEPSFWKIAPTICILIYVLVGAYVLLWFGFSSSTF